MVARARADYLIALFTIFCMTLAVGSGGRPRPRLSIGSIRGQAIADNPTAIRGRPAGERMVSRGQPSQRRGRVLPPPNVVCRLSQSLSERERLRLPAPLLPISLFFLFYCPVFLSPTHHGVAREQIRRAIRPVHSSMG